MKRLCRVQGPSALLALGPRAAAKRAGTWADLRRALTALASSRPPSAAGVPSPAAATHTRQPPNYRVAAAADSRSQEGAGKGTGGF
jgi:hypothetical protein